jgi:hypothetical protein
MGSKLQVLDVNSRPRGQMIDYPGRCAYQSLT